MEKLNHYQRWALINQYLMLEKMYPERAVDLKKKRLIFEDGHASLYSQVLSQGLRDGLTAEGYQEIEDILWMFVNLQNACEPLPPGHGLNLKSLQFKGFHSRGESSRHSYAQYVLNVQERFKGLEYKTTSDLMLPRYRRMLQVWGTCAEQPTLDDLKRISDAATEGEDNIRQLIPSAKRRINVTH